MEKLKDITGSIKDKLTGSKDKYHSSLLGESLADLLRRATAKTLVTPDDSVNQQVVYAIQQEVASGKDTKELVSLLKKRLRTDNPQKQWLGILLFDKVLSECNNVLGMHQEELLQEVARVMARPARPETEAGKSARLAARELLRRYGRAGTTAFRAAHQEVYGRPMGYAGGNGYPVGAVPYGYNPADYGAGNQAAALQAQQNLMSVERQSLAQEVHLLIDKARSNSELLSDMLVNTPANGTDEFEQELIQDLLAEVVELRGLFDAYLEPLQTHEGPDMEVLMVQALEAADMLDSCIALQKDVAQNQQMAPVAPAPTSPTAGASSSAAAAGTAAAAAPLAAAGASKPQDDLIALDDLADGLSQATLTPTHTEDPFAASSRVVNGAGGSGTAPSGAGGAAPQPMPLTSAFEHMFNQAGGSAAYQQLSAAAPAAPGQAAPTTAPVPVPGPSAPAPVAGPTGGYPAPGYNPYVGSPPNPGFGTSPPPIGYGTSPPPAGYGAGPTPPGYGLPHTPGYGIPPQPHGYYPQPTGYGAPPGAAGYPPPGQYGGPPQYGAQPQGVQAQQSPFGVPGGGAPVAPSTNPFAASAGGGPSDGGAGYGMPLPPPGLMGAAMPTTSSNPFAAPSTTAKGQNAVDQEWDLFFADRAGGGQAGKPPANTQQVAADFDALVAKPAR